MNVGGGEIAWAALMAALVVAYMVGLKRDDGLRANQIVKMALIWVGIIGAAYFLVSWFTGMS
ncbi:hypothetical protein [Qipengyuania vesicularis]|uniref:hypothetical protein n=1 Tax=Qipengyuania vesicularis TaxID=2867232 RepID=UPI001C873282|nr:hypothetical protein [Qipengyuania vesicularis]MBX7526818.1 hypothetical protein [Qipengyuania vesicularis]